MGKNTDDSESKFKCRQASRNANALASACGSENCSGREGVSSPIGRLLKYCFMAASQFDRIQQNRKKHRKSKRQRETESGFPGDSSIDPHISHVCMLDSRTILATFDRHMHKFFVSVASCECLQVAIAVKEREEEREREMEEGEKESKREKESDMKESELQCIQCMISHCALTGKQRGCATSKKNNCIAEGAHNIT
jgi:hypothetical protein